MRSQTEGSVPFHAQNLGEKRPNSSPVWELREVVREAQVPSFHPSVGYSVHHVKTGQQNASRKEKESFDFTLNN